MGKGQKMYVHCTFSFGPELDLNVHCTYIFRLCLLGIFIVIGNTVLVRLCVCDGGIVMFSNQQMFLPEQFFLES